MDDTLDTRNNYQYFCPSCFREGSADLTLHDILNGWRCPHCRRPVRLIRVAYVDGKLVRTEVPT